MLNVLANLWGLNNNASGNASGNSPVARKKKRKNHHKKNNKNIKIVDNDDQNDADADDNDNDNDMDDFIIHDKSVNNDDNDIYKSDSIKDVSHQIIEEVKILAKKDHRCLNKDVSHLLSDKYVLDIITFMFEGGYEYDNPEAIFNTIIANNNEIFQDDNFNIIDNDIISDDMNSLIPSTSTIAVNDVPTKLMDAVNNNDNNSIGTEQYLDFLSKLDQDSIPNQLELLVVNPNMNDNLSILCRWFEDNNIKQKNKYAIFLKSKTLEHIFEKICSNPEILKIEKTKIYLINLLKLIFTTSSTSGDVSNNEVNGIVNDIVLYLENVPNQTNAMFSHYTSNDGKRKALQLIAVKMSRIIRNLLIRIQNSTSNKNCEESLISKLVEDVDNNVSKLKSSVKKIDNSASAKDKFDAREVEHEIVSLFLTSLEEMRKEISINSKKQTDKENVIIPIEDEKTLEILFLEYSGDNMSLLMSKLSQNSQIKSHLDDLRSEKEKKVTNLKTDSMRLYAKVNELKLQQQSLLNKIQSIENEITQIMGATKILESKIQEVNFNFEHDMNLTAQNQSQKDVISAIQFQDSVSQVVDNIKTMENALSGVFLFSSTSFNLNGTSKNITDINLSDQYNKRLHQSLEPLRQYLISESTCVNFLSDRIVQNVNMMETLKVEKDNFVKLKMNSMAGNLQSKIKDIEIGINEDRNALITIQSVIIDTLFRFVRSFTITSFDSSTNKLLIPSEPLSSIMKSLNDAGVIVKEELHAFFKSSVSSSPRDR